ncbi:hypothetical protein SPRG_17763, partial [Saprolegnia parasitica CBS 223.65]
WIANDITLWQSMRPTPVFVGEWSLASATGITGHLANRTTMTRYANRALQAMNNAKAGWTYWSWKIDYIESGQPNGWNMQYLLRSGVFNLTTY